MATCPHHRDQELIAECIKFSRRFCAKCFHDSKTREQAVCLSPHSHCKYRTSCLVWELSKDSRRKRKKD
jgi:hypothetical protein